MGYQDQSPTPKVYERPILTTLAKDSGQFSFVFAESGLKCCERAQRYAGLCCAAPNELNTLSPDLPGFVYLDCGAWLDDAEGNGTRRRDLGLVDGPHVYLCQFTGIQEFENAMNGICGPNTRARLIQEYGC